MHGLASSFEHGWRESGWIDLLGDGGRDVIGVDLLGHGSAPRPTDPAAYADFGGRVRDALPDGPVDAIGFSAGAIVLLELAVEDASRFNRLVLIGVGQNVFRDDDHEVLARAFEGGGGDGADIGARVFVSLAETAGNDPAAIAACVRRPRRVLKPDDLAAVTCPTLVIIGDRDFAGPADPLVDALPDARLTLLPGVDHFQATRDFRCIDAALEFLDVKL